MNRLSDQTGKQGDLVFYDEDFMSILEQNLTYIKNTVSSSTGVRNAAEIPPSEAVACAGDFRKVCVYLGIPIYLHWITARLNGLLCYEDYKSEMTTISLVDDGILQRLKLTDATTQTNI